MQQNVATRELNRQEEGEKVKDTTWFCYLGSKMTRDRRRAENIKIIITRTKRIFPDEVNNNGKYRLGYRAWSTELCEVGVGQQRSQKQKDIMCDVIDNYCELTGLITEEV